MWRLLLILTYYVRRPLSCDHPQSLCKYRYRSLHISAPHIRTSPSPGPLRLATLVTHGGLAPILSRATISATRYRTIGNRKAPGTTPYAARQYESLPRRLAITAHPPRATPYPHYTECPRLLLRSPPTPHRSQASRTTATSHNHPDPPYSDAARVCRPWALRPPFIP